MVNTVTPRILNYLSVKGYGESEYWFALIKVTTIIIFIVLIM
ncbi:MAG: hypothetical protein K6U74_05580 [Firmicutes bacterium]|nr:hypothetical protein [Bacillota bacterium]